MKISVVYLARSESSSVEDFVPFANSYKKYSAGLEHELVIIRKGETRQPDSIRALDELFQGMNYTCIDRPDNGYDIHAYLDAASQLDHEFICFLNTFSEIQSDDWLAKLLAPHLTMKDCGITGATGSFESLYDSTLVNSKVIWGAMAGKIPYDFNLHKMFKDEIELHIPSWINPDQAKDFVSNVDEQELTEGFKHYFAVMAEPNGPLDGFDLFKPFPNPHIRSNAFLVNRKLLLELGIEVGPRKVDCNQFESGLRGLPTRLAELGLKQVLVGADGRSFPVEEWFKSGTFRCGNQENILVKDNQASNFDNAGPERKQLFKTLSWGKYSGEPAEVIKKLGFHFEKGCLKLSYGKKSRICVKKEPFISIVIPASFYCNNILDMIYTVSKQNYQNWECIVFDNNLDRPLSEVIEDIGDSRVKIFRSEKLLSTAQCWNSAVDKATGDYVCVIGDDGGVGPLFMRTVADIVRSNKPDMIYSSVFKLLSSRGSPTGSLGSCVDLPSRSYSSNVASSFRLGSKYAIDVARASLSFRRAILFNMQSLIFERGFLNYLRRDGLIFHSPLPDQYLANLGFCLAKSIVIAPKPIAIAGVSGNYIGNRSLYEDDNFKDSFPGTINMNDPIYNILKSKILPGSLFNTHYLVTMRYLQDHLDDFSPSEVDFDRYRKLQIAANLFHSNEDNWIGEVNYTVREQLTAQENEWLENLIDLTNRCETDESARTTLAEIRSELAIFAFSPVAQPVDTRSFKTLPQFYRAWVRGEVKAP